MLSGFWNIPLYGSDESAAFRRQRQLHPQALIDRPFLAIRAYPLKKKVVSADNVICCIRRFKIKLPLVVDRSVAQLSAVCAQNVVVRMNNMVEPLRACLTDADHFSLRLQSAQIPVNRSRCPFLNMYHRDGQMRVDGNHGSTLGYEPNSYGEWQHQTEYKEPPLELDGAAYQWEYREDDSDYFFQAGDLFRLMTPAQQQVLFENTARAMGNIPEEIKLRHIRNCMKADAIYGKGIAEALGISLTHPGLAEA